MTKTKRIKNLDKRGPIPVHLAEAMAGKIRAVSEKSGLSNQDILRLAIERGLPKLEEMFEVKKAA